MKNQSKSQLLQLNHIRKSFGAVKALCGVDMEIKSGEIHALIGENGAGKSTLMKILSGAHQPDEGEMIFKNTAYRPKGPIDAKKAGIVMIYQELTLAPHLTVEENITLGLEKSTFGFTKSQKKSVAEALALLGQEEINPFTIVSKLSIGKQQLVEIARALLTETKLIIMDEPTSSLSSDDTHALFAVIRKLKQKGISIIYISHFLEEVQEICDRFTVMRDGETVATGDIKAVSIAEIITSMVGRSVSELYPENIHKITDMVLEVRNLQGVKLPKDVSFSLKKGEILGIAGIVGAGRSEMIRSLFGLHTTINGEVTIAGNSSLKAYYLKPQKSLNSGMNLLSENRKEEGLALNMSIASNITLSALAKYASYGILNLKKELAETEKWSKKLNIKKNSALQPAGGLSGGNQQKICIARLLHHESDILFLDEPTRGIDVGSKAEIYKLIHELAAQRKAIVMISSYLPELLGVCDTLAVMYKGKLSEVKPVSMWQENDVMVYATSGSSN